MEFQTMFRAILIPVIILINVVIQCNLKKTTQILKVETVYLYIRDRWTRMSAACPPRVRDFSKNSYPCPRPWQGRKGQRRPRQGRPWQGRPRQGRTRVSMSTDLCYTWKFHNLLQNY